MYYYIIYSCLWFFSIISSDKSFRYLTKVSVISIFIILYVTLIFRADSVSPDQANYRIIFNQYSFPDVLNIENLWYSHVDFLYGVLNGVVKYIGLEFRHFIYFYSFLNLSFLFFGFYSLSKKINVSLIWTLTFYYSHFFLYREMLQVRPGLSYAVCLSALYFLCTDRKLIFIIGILLATLIHKSAIIFMLVPLWILFIDRLGLALALSISLATLLSLNYLIPTYAPLVLGNAASKAYVLSNHSDFAGSQGRLNPTMIKYIFLSAVAYFYIGMRDSREWSIILGTYTLAAITLFSLSNYYVLGGRLASIFAIVEPLIIVKLLSSWAISQRNIAMKILVIFIGITLGLILLSLNLDIKNVLNDYKFSIR